MPTFTFRHAGTGQLRIANRSSLNEARNALRLPPNEDWKPWECREGDDVWWHMTEDGDCVSGPRPESSTDHRGQASPRLKAIAQAILDLPDWERTQIGAGIDMHLDRAKEHGLCTFHYNDVVIAACEAFLKMETTD